VGFDDARRYHTRLVPSRLPTSARSRHGSAADPDRTPASVRLSLALAIAAAALLRGWLMARLAGITMDSPLYVTMAESLQRGARASGPAHHGYPALVALVGWIVPGRELPGRLVSFAAGVLLVPLVERLARTTAGPRWSLGAAWLVALHPLLAVYSTAVMTEASFLAVAGAGFLLLMRRRPLAAGATLGFSYLVRPEGIVYAAAAPLFARLGRRGLALAWLGSALVVAPYLGYLRWERGSWMLSPKDVVVRPVFESRGEAEWRIGGPRPIAEPHRSLIERLRWAAPSVARRYLPHLLTHLRLLLEAWPWPLLLLSAVGLAAYRGPPIAGLLTLPLLPALAVPFDVRFTQLLVPWLAAYAAAGGAWASSRRWSRAVAVASAALAVAGLTWCWIGSAGRVAVFFDDGPMPEMRAAGAWLKEHARPDATVMDRKAYVAFFAGLKHVQLPNDDYDTILSYARSSGADYLVIEEYIVRQLRPQLMPLVADPAFRQRERRVRLVHLEAGRLHAGVAVFEVMRTPAAGTSP